MISYEPRYSKSENFEGKRIWWFVLTGGPCSGKTTGEARAENELTNAGYKIFFADEAASRVINSGVSAKVVGNYKFQRSIAKEQIHNECRLLDEIREYISTPGTRDNIIVICDRGLIDGKAYMDNENTFGEMLMKEFGISESEAKCSYDGVIHLVTAADGAEEYYTLSNNKARTESPEEARAIDKKTFAAWNGHHHVALIDNSTNFEKKMDRVMAEIYKIMGKPIPTDSFVKYLVEMPNFEQLEKDFYCKFSKVKITRTFSVNSDDSFEQSVIKRESDGGAVYFYIEKCHYIDGDDQIQLERRISKRDYEDFLTKNDGRKKEIVKTRYGFVWNNKYYELDKFDFWNDRAILKIQLTDKSSKVEMPAIFKKMMEVTHDKSYMNYSLAQNVYN